MASSETELSLVDAVYARLRDMIVTNALQAGQRLVERDLAELLGISRTPVRGALGLLAASGLVENRTRRGFHVCRLSAEHAADLYEFRTTLEVDAARLATVRATASDIAEFDALLREVDGLAPEIENHAGAVQIDMRIHSLIARVSGNWHLQQAICGVLDKVMCFISVEVGDRASLAAAQREHQAILRAIIRRDSDEAAELLGLHIAAACDSLIKKLKAREDLQRIVLSAGTSRERRAAGHEPVDEIQEGALT